MEPECKIRWWDLQVCVLKQKLERICQLHFPLLLRSGPDAELPPLLPPVQNPCAQTLPIASVTLQWVIQAQSKDTFGSHEAAMHEAARERRVERDLTLI